VSVRTVVGMGIYYEALRQIDSGPPQIVLCRGDEESAMDRQEAVAEQDATDCYRLTLPPKRIWAR
jgi:hypothetical protein